LALLGYCALAALPLAFSPIFQLDWANHVWYAAYVSHALSTQWTVPTFVNAPGFVGNPVLTFYGAPLYVALAPFVALFGAERGMRVAAAVALAVPALTLARLFLSLGTSRLAAGCLTICLSVSVYQLTNLYTRSAMTEFFAYQLVLLGAILLLA